MWVFFFFPNPFKGKSKLGFQKKKKKKAFWCYLERQPSKLLLWNWNLRFWGGFFSSEADKTYDKSSVQAACRCSPIWEPQGGPGHPWGREGHHAPLRRGEIVSKCSTAYVVGPAAVGCFAKCQEREIWEIRGQSQSVFQVCDILIPGGAGNSLKVKFRYCLTSEKAEGK